jgi:hypothetical protein
MWFSEWLLVIPILMGWGGQGGSSRFHVRAAEGGVSEKWILAAGLIAPPSLSAGFRA